MLVLGREIRCIIKRFGISDDIYEKIIDIFEEIESIHSEYTLALLESLEAREKRQHAYDEYNAAREDSTVTEEQLANLLQNAKAVDEECELIINNCQAIIDSYDNKCEEQAKEVILLIPQFDDENWIKYESPINPDTWKYPGKNASVVWTTGGEDASRYDVDIYYFGEDQDKLESIVLDKTEITLIEGSEETLTPTIIPADVADKIVVWTSDNESVATVKDGKVTALSEGIATITASTSDGKVSATCKVTVNKKVEEKPVEENKEEKLPTILPDTGSKSLLYIYIITTLAIIGIVTYKKVKDLNFK